MPSKFSVSWVTFKNSICEGLAGLQQDQEYVDLTLAADGHFVKVHKIVIALASPYLKDLMSTFSSQNPVIFLNEVSSQILHLLLEYIYTGETVVPMECMTQFAKVGKALRINGLENLVAANEELLRNKHSLDLSLCPPRDPKTVEIRKPKILVKIPLDNNSQVFQNTGTSNIAPQPTELLSAPEVRQRMPEDFSDESMDFDSQDQFDVRGMLGDQLDSNEKLKKDDNKSNSENTIDKEQVNDKLLYTTSIRDCLQIILNRFIYNLDYTKNKGIRRWRCSEYRNKKCAAWLLTKDNLVLKRANLHNHAHHDGKIESKVAQRAVFTSIEEAERADAKASRDEDSTVLTMRGDDASADSTGEWGTGLQEL